MILDIRLTTGNPNVGKAFHIRDTIKGRYFYPREPGMYSTDLRIVENVIPCGHLLLLSLEMPSDCFADHGPLHFD